jgi:hypothetical protein
VSILKWLFCGKIPACSINNNEKSNTPVRSGSKVVLEKKVNSTYFDNTICFESVSKLQIALKDKAQAGEKAQHTRSM